MNENIEESRAALAKATTWIAQLSQSRAKLHAEQNDRDEAVSAYSAALAKHRDLMQSVALGVAEPVEQEAARKEVLDLKAKAEKPDRASEIQTLDLEIEEATRDRRAAHLALIGAIGRDAAQRYQEATITVLSAKAVIDAIGQAATEDLFYFGSLPGDLREMLRSTYAQNVAASQRTTELRNATIQFIRAVPVDAGAKPPNF